MPFDGIMGPFDLSPIARRRLRNFRANRRGVWSLRIFLALFTLTLFADFLANDRPVMVWFEGHAFMPIFAEYAETTFGGDFATETDFRDPYVAELIADKGWMLWPIIRFRFDTIDQEAEGPAPGPPPVRPRPAPACDRCRR